MHFAEVCMISRGMQDIFKVTTMQKWNSLLIYRFRDLWKGCLRYVNTHSDFQMSILFAYSHSFSSGFVNSIAEKSIDPSGEFKGSCVEFQQNTRF